MCRPRNVDFWTTEYLHDERTVQNVMLFAFCKYDHYNSGHYFSYFLLLKTRFGERIQFQNVG
jgi:hypothetical protein